MRKQLCPPVATHGEQGHVGRQLGTLPQRAQQIVGQGGNTA
jgi:hypothetical protein